MELINKFMKLYVWKRKKSADNLFNFYPLSKIVPVKKGFYAEAIHAFFRKKDAKKYLDEIGWEKSTQELFEIKTINL